MFIKRAQEEIEREKQFKQHFITNNNIQMIRSKALMESINGSHRSDPIVEEGDIKILRFHNHSNSLMNTSPKKPLTSPEKCKFAFDLIHS